MKKEKEIDSTITITASPDPISLQDPKGHTALVSMLYRDVHTINVYKDEVDGECVPVILIYGEKQFRPVGNAARYGSIDKAVIAARKELDKLV